MSDMETRACCNLQKEWQGAKAPVHYSISGTRLWGPEEHFLGHILSLELRAQAFPLLPQEVTYTRKRLMPQPGSLKESSF